MEKDKVRIDFVIKNLIELLDKSVEAYINVYGSK